MHLFLFLIMLFVVSCNHQKDSISAVKVDPYALDGKSKAEIIVMMLHSSPKNANSENIVVPQEEKCTYSYHCVTSKNKASGDRKLLESDM